MRDRYWWFASHPAGMLILAALLFALSSLVLLGLVALIELVVRHVA